jgi:signal peptidase I
LLVASLAVMVFAYGYWVGIVSHPGSFAYVRVSGEEMRPTLGAGDLVLIDRNFYTQAGTRPKRGDLVWIEPTEKMKTKNRLVLRVAAVTGDSLTLNASGELLINGDLASQIPELAGVDCRPAVEDFLEGPVESNELFVVADNPSYTDDARVAGTVPIKNVRGKAVSILFPPNRVGKFEN